MRIIIHPALNIAHELLMKQIPLTKKLVKSISIMDVNPLELQKFMKENKVPDTAYFDGRDNGYDAFDDILLSWEVRIPTTEKDTMKFKRNRFTSLAWNEVRGMLLSNGYERVGYDAQQMAHFDDTTVYDMYINNEIGRLEHYYSLAFKKK
jgi:hypothetical protein